jgi:hypothetical protein
MFRDLLAHEFVVGRKQVIGAAVTERRSERG